MIFHPYNHNDNRALMMGNLSKLENKDMLLETRCCDKLIACSTGKYHDHMLYDGLNETNSLQQTIYLLDQARKKR